MVTERVARDNITARRRSLVAGWEQGWRQMIEQWCENGPDAVWLMNSANYLLRTAGRRWAIDPVTLTNLVPEAKPMPIDDLASLEWSCPDLVECERGSINILDDVVRTRKG